MFDRNKNTIDSFCFVVQYGSCVISLFHNQRGTLAVKQARTQTGTHTRTHQPLIDTMKLDSQQQQQTTSVTSVAPERIEKITSDMSTLGDIPIMPKVDVDALADRCLNLLRESQKENHEASHCANGFNCYNQVFIGIAGTPGSGKSYIAEQVSKRIQERNPNGDAKQAECIVIGMDGYHLTRQELKEKAAAGEKIKTDEDGSVEYKQLSYKELMARRGAGFTYDPVSFIRDLRKVKENGQGSFPVYDRDKHDPVPDGVRVEQHHKIILVEGLYLLCLHDPDWQPLEELWDDRWYIDVSIE